MKNHLRMKAEKCPRVYSTILTKILSILSKRPISTKTRVTVITTIEVILFSNTILRNVQT